MNKRIFLFLGCLVLSSVYADEVATVKSVNFIQDGEISKLIIDIDRPVQAERNAIIDDKQIILDLKNIKSDKKFLRGIDTSEFSGATVFVSPYKKPGSKNDLRFAIQLRDNVRSFLENKTNRIILNIENRFGVFSRTKLKKAESQDLTAKITASNEKVFIPKSASLEDILTNLTQSGVKRYVGKKISINVNSVPYQEVLKMIADTSAFNIIIDDEINKLAPLTISLTNLPWDQVLDTIMNLGKLVAYKHGNILTMRTEDQAREDKKRELDTANQNKVLEPLVTKIFRISYAESASISKILESYLSKDRGSLQIDERTRSLIVKDTVDVIDRMKKIIDTLDKQTPQILIESRIVEADENYEFRAGLGKGGLRIGYDPVSSGATIGSQTSTGSFSFSSAPDTDSPNLLSLSLSAVKRLANLDFTLELMESESKGRVISSPKVITENNKQATITNDSTQNFLVGTRDSSGNVTNEIEAVTASISLDVTPKVTNEGSIAMKVDIKKQGFGSQTAANTVPNITSNKVSTNVLVNNGSTVVIGGLYQTSDSKIVSGIPFLKDLPLVGWLFRNSYNPKKSRSELIIFLTPRIVNQEEAGLINSELGGLTI